MKDTKVPLDKLQKARKYVAKHKNINWYSDPNKLDEKAIVEGVLNYGSWDDFEAILDVFGKSAFRDIFYDLTDSSRLRINLRPRTVKFFNKYLEKHA